MPGPLGLDDDALAGCVQCGLCLTACPTWQSEGREARSPRGRIDAMRDVEWRGVRPDDGFAEVIGSCVGCRACETACPSGVRYGELLEATRTALAAGGPAPVPWWRRIGLSLLDRPLVVRAGALAVAVLQRIGGARRGPLANLPRLPLRRRPLRSTGGDVVLLTGCVMDATGRDTHRAVLSVMGSAGIGVTVQPARGCCGALAAHAGLADLATNQIRRLAAAVPSGVPVVSDSAGCAAAIHTAATHGDAPPEVVDLARRTEDVSAFLVRHLDDLPAPPTGSSRPAVTVQDPCHQRHVLGTHAAVGELLSRWAEVRRPRDEAMCCGAGGAFSIERPDEAARIRDRKVASLRECGADVVASANPGCSMHLRAGGVDARHPVEIVRDLLGAQDPRPGRRRGGDRGG